MEALITGGLGLAGSALSRPDTSAQRAQLAQNQRSQEFTEQAAAEAAGVARGLFGGAEQNLLAGNQAALNFLGQAIPAQMQATQQGSGLAQQQIAGGLPQIQNALMGLPVDYSAFQPRNVNVDSSYLQQQLAPVTSLTSVVPEMVGRAPELLALQGQLGTLQSEIDALRASQSDMSSRWDRLGGGGQADRGGPRGGRDRGGRTSSGGRANSAGGAAGRGPGGSV